MKMNCKRNLRRTYQQVGTVINFLEKKVGKLLISHRSTAYPCFLPNLGEFSRSWSYKTYPAQKYTF